MCHQLVTAKTNATTELLLLIDDKIVSQWPYEPVAHIGDLRDWDNQSDYGRDLSDLQADFDAGRLELDQVLSEQCDLQDFWSKFELDSLWFVSHGYPAGCEITEDIHESLSFLGDVSDYWGKISDSDTWGWDGDSGEPIDERGNTIVNLKASRFRKLKKSS